MKRERVFSSQGWYASIMKSEALMHEEAAAVCAVSIKAWSHGRSAAMPVRILDLACGAEPRTVFKAISALGDLHFEYTGVDVNPDQVQALRNYQRIPPNVTLKSVREGDIWKLDEISLSRRPDLIFVGLNLHHGSAQQISNFLLKAYALLSDRGLYLNHDFFRPARHSIFEPKCGASVHDWRSDFTEVLESYLRERGCPEQGIAQNAKHIMRYDYPHSIADITQMMCDAGFAASVYGFEATNHALREYFAVVEGKKASA